MSNRLALAGIGIVAVQGILMLVLSRAEYLPSPPPLVDLPSSIGPWETAGDLVLEPEVLELLTPDDVLNRNYENSTQVAALNLFIAYYKTQHKAGQAHDPKVCLPGSGWNPITSKTIEIPVVDSNTSFPANLYVITKDPEKAVVVYWYQSYNRVFAQEQVFRLNRLLDMLNQHRTDMALIRIVAQVENDDLPPAADRATRFAQSVYPLMRRQFPPRS